MTTKIIIEMTEDEHKEYKKYIDSINAPKNSIDRQNVLKAFSNYEIISEVFDRCGTDILLDSDGIFSGEGDLEMDKGWAIHITATMSKKTCSDCAHFNVAENVCGRTMFGFKVSENGDPCDYFYPIEEAEKEELE